MRGSVGCLGVFIGVVTVIAWLAIGPSGNDSNDADEPPFVGGELANGPGGIVVDALATAAVRTAYEDAETLADAERATRELVRASEELGMAPAAVRALLLDGVPDAAAWADDAPAMIDRLVPEPTESIEPRDVVAIRDEVSLYTTAEALEAYATLLRSGRSDEMDLVRRSALEERLTDEIAADTLAALAARVDDLSDDLDEAREDLRETEDELESLESRGLVVTLRSLLDELGFGFGWASVYFTVMLSWWKGQTIGKRLMRVRVLRLDGGAITWWVAFERAGGYAAGLATGFLGFLQIFWDANRQAIHDRIVGTVVALDPPQKVIDWESLVTSKPLSTA
jgi:hypothetical protein